jgi:hypothetical protein
VVSCKEVRVTYNSFRRVQFVIHGKLVVLAYKIMVHVIVHKLTLRHAGYEPLCDGIWLPAMWEERTAERPVALL